MLKSLRQSKTGCIGLAIVLILVFCALTANFIAPHDPAEQDIMNKLKDPIWCAGGSFEHILGTDQLGRDILSRLIYGSRITLLVAFCGTACSVLLGVTLGTLAGYYGKWVDAVIMRIADIQLAFPFTLLAIFIAAVLGSGLGNIIFIAAINSWVRYARVVRGEILGIKEIEYVEAIRSLGGTDTRIMFRHILPNIISPVIVLSTLEIARVVLMEASLSFLGLGVPISIPTWGRMLSDGRAYMMSAPWLAILPGVLITITVMGVNLLGDWLRDYLDPKLDV